MKGWIKIHRKMLENPIVMKDSDHLAVWVYLLLNAAHKERKVLFKGDKIMLQPGQLITGRNAIADFLGISESKVKRVLSDFEGDQQIDRQRSNKNSLISLINWDKYQFFDQQSDQQVTSKMTSKWTTNVPENRQQSDQQTNSRKPAENGHFEDSEDQQVTSKMTSQRPADIPKSDQQSDHKQEDKEDKKEKRIDILYGRRRSTERSKHGTILDSVRSKSFPHLPNAIRIWWKGSRKTGLMMYCRQYRRSGTVLTCRERLRAAG